MTEPPLLPKVSDRIGSGRAIEASKGDLVAVINALVDIGDQMSEALEGIAEHDVVAAVLQHDARMMGADAPLSDSDGTSERGRWDGVIGELPPNAEVEMYVDPFDRDQKRAR